MTMVKRYYTPRPVPTETVLLVEADFEEIRDYFANVVNASCTVTLNDGVWHFHFEDGMVLDYDYNTGDSVIYGWGTYPWTPEKAAASQEITQPNMVYTLETP
jgi:hypothetical protein